MENHAQSEKIEINYNDFEDLKYLHKHCEDGESFEFKGRQLNKDYAGYLIKHLEGQFDRISRV